MRKQSIESESKAEAFNGDTSHMEPGIALNHFVKCAPNDACGRSKPKVPNLVDCGIGFSPCPTRRARTPGRTHDALGNTPPQLAVRRNNSLRAPVHIACPITQVPVDAIAPVSCHTHTHTHYNSGRALATTAVTKSHAPKATPAQPSAALLRHARNNARPPHQGRSWKLGRDITRGGRCETCCTKLHAHI